MNLMRGILCLVALVPLGAYGTTEVAITEQDLKKWLSASPPSIQEIEAQYLSAERDYLSLKDKMGFTLNSDARVFKSEERLLNQFDGGVQQRATQFNIGINKPTAYGVQVGVNAFSQKSTNAFVSDAASAGLAVNMSVDLFRDFLGRRTKKQLKKSKFGVERAKIQERISKKAFESSARKVYWSLILNDQKEELLKSLVNSSERQYKASMKRRRSGVADAGEVAKYKSQWTTRKANLLSIEYNKRNLIRTLREMFPSIEGLNIKLGKYDLEQTRKEVLLCAQTIATHKDSPVEYTSYDELAEILRQEEKIEHKLIGTYNEPELKLVGEYATVGRDFGIDAAYDNYRDDDRPRQSIGLQLIIPIDNTKSKTKEVSQKINQKLYAARVQSRISKLKAFHSETKRVILLLQQMVKNQQDTNKSLSTSMKLSKKKFRQARISLENYINEQDSYVQSQLVELDTKLAVINTMLDYFAIYTEIPCEFNRI